MSKIQKSLENQYRELLESKGLDIDLGMSTEISGLNAQELNTEIEYVSSLTQTEFNNLYKAE